MATELQSGRAPAAPFRFFDLTITRIADLTPSFRRIWLSGPDAADFGDPGWDQRIKLVLPVEGLGYGRLPRGEGWYDAWRHLPTEERHPIRTYTTRLVRDGQIAVDVVRHHPQIGPAARWIEQVEVGQDLVILGPNARYAGTSGGIDFLPPDHTESFLLVGDETAAPAIAVMLENLPGHARGVAVVELPADDDAAYLRHHPGLELRCFARSNRSRGDAFVAEGERAARELAPAGQGHEVTEIDVDSELLWEVPRHARGGAALSATSMYAWIAGEAGSVKALRRTLVGSVGVDRRAVAFMGYWRLGRAEN